MFFSLTCTLYELISTHNLHVHCNGTKHMIIYYANIIENIITIYVPVLPKSKYYKNYSSDRVLNSKGKNLENWKGVNHHNLGTHTTFLTLDRSLFCLEFLLFLVWSKTSILLNPSL